MIHRNIHNNDIIKLYESGLSSIQVANELNTTKRLVLGRLKKCNIVRRTISKALRKYNINEHFFDIIDCELKAYWLGFLLADGNIGRSGRNGMAYQLRCTLQRRDHEHLTKLASHMQSNHPVTNGYSTDTVTGKKHPITKLIITSKTLGLALLEKGWDDFKKKGSCKILEKTPTNLQRHIVRGLIDGDGWLCYSSRWVIGYCDLHKSVVEWVRNWINHGNPSIKQPKMNKSYAVHYTGGRQTRHIANILYSDASVYLSRKYIAAQNITSQNTP